MGFDQGAEIGGPVGSAWREQVLTRVAEQRTMLAWLLADQGAPDAQSMALADAIRAHLDAARQAADSGSPRPTPRASIGGATLERASSHLDAVECDLLRLANHRYRRGQLPSLLAHVRRHLETEDPRRAAVEQLALRAPDQPWHDTDRERVLSALHAANSEARREVRQVRSFRNTLVATGIALTIAAIAMALVGWRSPGSIPLCFRPGDLIVCPTTEISVETTAATAADHAKVDAALRGATSPGDVALIELLGMMAAALSGALALRNIKGTSSPYGLPITLAVLKLPTGALTAVLAILLMRGDFVPGLSALDSSAQILAWAIIFGYAQQLLTQLVDRQANTVLESVRSGGTAPAGTAIAGIGMSGEPFAGGAGGTSPVVESGPSSPAQPPEAAADEVVEEPEEITDLPAGRDDDDDGAPPP